MSAIPEPEPVVQPGYGSMTFLRHADACLHSAYLYRKHAGGAPSIPKLRGTLLHACWERLLRTLVERGESTLYAQQPDEDFARVRREVASFTEALVEEVRAEHPELHVPASEADAVRMMLFHLAAAQPVDPGKLIAIERTFVIDILGWEIRCRVDAAELDGETIIVTDCKTAFAIAGDEEYRHSFQRKVYSLAILFGHPEGVSREQWARTVNRVGWVTGREVYPRYLRDDGSLAEPTPVTMSRTDLHDFRVDLERLVARVDQAARANEFPATPGHHCFTCPASFECPLPAGHRGPRGTEEGITIEPIEILSPEDAVQWAQTWHWHREWATAIRKALRGHAKTTEQPIRFARDFELCFKRVNKDGGRKVETVFDRRRLSPEELEEER